MRLRCHYQRDYTANTLAAKEDNVARFLVCGLVRFGVLQERCAVSCYQRSIHLSTSGRHGSLVPVHKSTKRINKFLLWELQYNFSKEEEEEEEEEYKSAVRGDDAHISHRDISRSQLHDICACTKHTTQIFLQVFLQKLQYLRRQE
jgi:hypothetical protein